MAVLAALASTGASAQTNLGAQTPQASLPFVMTRVATPRGRKLRIRDRVLCETVAL